MPTLIDIFGYEIGCWMGSPSVNSWCDFDDAVQEGLKGETEDAVWVFVDASRDVTSLGFIGSWADA